ncbi:MAG: methionine--tRNA ligase, partial [Clostridiales bacterium]
PAIHITRKEFDKFNALHLSLADAILIDEPKKPSVTFEFESLETRDAARAVLDGNTIRYRTGKTLVPFRLSGNIPWGVPVPQRDGLDDLTFWVWPESLWAPISFLQTYLESIGKSRDEWSDWCIKDDAKVYQFIGEDNIYFYGIAEMGMLLAYLGHGPQDAYDVDDINFPTLVANCHLQFMNSKASSSGKVKPPMADELLQHYTKDQLRMYFLSLGLAKKGVSFNPKPYDPSADPKVADPVLKDGNLLTNVFNRTVRSAFYTAQKYTAGRIPNLPVSEEILNLIEKDTLNYEQKMASTDFHLVIYALDHVIRHLSKYWSKQSKKAGEDQAAIEQLLADTFYAIKSILTLLHPIVPESSERAAQRLNLTDDLWNWQHILKPTQFYMEDAENHTIVEIPPKFDFFKKHNSQLADS